MHLKIFQTMILNTKGYGGKRVDLENADLEYSYVSDRKEYSEIDYSLNQIRDNKSMTLKNRI